MMALYPERAPFVRSREHMDRILDLIGRYWRLVPMDRFEQVIARVTPDYHYNSDEQLEAALTNNLKLHYGIRSAGGVDVAR